MAALDGNPYFSAGFSLGVLGTGMALMRGAGKAAVTLAKRHLLVTLEVTSKDRAYPWVLQWLTEQAQARTVLGQHMSVETVRACRPRCTLAATSWLTVTNHGGTGGQEARQRQDDHQV